MTPKLPRTGGAQMKVTDFSKYRGKRALVLIGTDDVDHPRELDMRIADWLNENGANADFWFLGDRGWGHIGQC
jgi:hypothetical protein